MAYNPAPQATVSTGSMPAPVSSTYCVPYVAQFVIDQKVLTISSGKFTIHDAQGTLLFDVKGKNPLGLHTKRILRDASGKTVVLMQKKLVSMHDRWAVYRGDSDSDGDLLFSVGKSTAYQIAAPTFQPSFEVFLPTNNSSRPDFLVRGDFFEHNFTVLYGNTPVAEVRKKMNVQSLVMGKDQYGVTVSPGVDHAFIASLIVIVDQQKQDDVKQQQKHQQGGGGGLGGGLGGGGLGGRGFGGGGGGYY